MTPQNYVLDPTPAGDVQVFPPGKISESSSSPVATRTRARMGGRRSRHDVARESGALRSSGLVAEPVADAGRAARSGHRALRNAGAVVQAAEPARTGHLVPVKRTADCFVRRIWKARPT